jgi:hypothetical protein
MSSKQSTDDIAVCDLIALQRQLCQSTNPFVRRLGTLWAVAVQDRHLAGLTDPQIAQLMLDRVGYALGIVQTESTVLPNSAE